MRQIVEGKLGFIIGIMYVILNEFDKLLGYISKILSIPKTEGPSGKINSNMSEPGK